MFLRPEFLIALVFWLPLSYFLLKKRTATSGWQSVIAPELLAALSPPVDKKHPNRWLIPFLGVLIIIALAGPSIENGNQQTASKGQLFILLDSSLSMTSPDVSPSRMVRAKRIINDWTSSGLFDRSSVIVYSASAHTLTPLTSDSETINTQLQALDPFLMPQFGNQPQTAFTLLQQTLENLPTTANHLLWLTDDVDEVDVAKIEAVGDVTGSFLTKTLIAIGTREGGVMPISEQQGPLQDANGNAIITRLNIGKVTQAADALGFNLGDITMQPSASLLGRFNSVQADQAGRADVGYFLLIPIALLFLWRTSAQSLLVCVIIGGSFLINQPSYANELFKNKNQRAYEALINGDADIALQQTSKPDIQAQALFDKNEFQTAADLFSDLSTADGFYNAANAQAQLGELEQALTLYDQALALEEHAGAKFNKEKIEEFLKQQQEQQQSESGDGEPQNPEDGGEENQGGSSDQPQSGDNPSDGENIQPPPEQADAEGEQGNQSEEEQSQTESNEQAEQPSDITERQQETRTEQAIESVLNQLESDPGSLLQRKFRYQFSQNPTDTDTLEW